MLGRWIFFLLTLMGVEAIWAQGLCVKFDKAVIRQKPTKKSPVIQEVARHTPLTWTGQKANGYYEVQEFYGKKGWVWRKSVAQETNCILIKVKKSRLRQGPGTNYPKSDILAAEGQVFRDLGGEDGWTKVVDGKGNQAWVNLDHIWRPRARLRLSYGP